MGTRSDPAVQSAWLAGYGTGIAVAGCIGLGLWACVTWEANRREQRSFKARLGMVEGAMIAARPAPDPSEPPLVPVRIVKGD